MRGPGSAAEQALDLLHVRGGCFDVERQPASAGGRLVLEQVSRVGLLAHDLPLAGHPEALLRTAVRLHLRHWSALSVGRTGWGGMLCCGGLAATSCVVVVSSRRPPARQPLLCSRRSSWPRTSRRASRRSCWSGSSPRPSWSVPCSPSWW